MPMHCCEKVLFFVIVFCAVDFFVLIFSCLYYLSSLKRTFLYLLFSCLHCLSFWLMTSWCWLFYCYCLFFWLSTFFYLRLSYLHCLSFLLLTSWYWLFYYYYLFLGCRFLFTCGLLACLLCNWPFRTCFFTCFLLFRTRLLLACFLLFRAWLLLACFLLFRTWLLLACFLCALFLRFISSYFLCSRITSVNFCACWINIVATDANIIIRFCITGYWFRCCF